MHCVTEWIEDGRDFAINICLVTPDIGHGKADVLGKSAGTVYPNAFCMGAKMAASRQAITATAAYYVPFAAHHFAGMKIVDIRTDGDDFAYKLVANGHRNRNGGLSPIVPLINMKVGTADAGVRYADEGIVDADLRFGYIFEREAGRALRLHQSLHDLVPKGTQLYVLAAMKVIYYTLNFHGRTSSLSPKRYRPHLQQVKALTIVPGQTDSAEVTDVPEPATDYGSIVANALELGICGTDFELIRAEYGWAPPGEETLVLGHESLGQVAEAPANSGFERGDLVVGIVRRPDPDPCMACGAGQPDMCRNGKYTERGIKELNGFGSERWRIEPEYAIKLDSSLRDVGVLMEPASVLAKAWDHITRIGHRAAWKPRNVLVTGAGPIGLLAALMGEQLGLEVHVLDRIKDGPKPKLVEDLGGKYYTGPIKNIGFRPDVIIECTGVAKVIAECLEQLGNDGILCLTGVSSPSQKIPLDLGTLNRTMVLENAVVFGSVNANRGHWESAEQTLRKASKSWLQRLISRKVPVSDWQQILQRHPDDIKVVMTFAV